MASKPKPHPRQTLQTTGTKDAASILKGHTPLSRLLFFISIGYLLLHIAASFFDSVHAFWGVNQIRFLPIESAIVILLGILFLFLYRRNTFAGILDTASKWSLVLFGLSLSALVYFLNIQAHILGDGANIIHNLLVSLKGESVTSRAPLTFAIVKQMSALLNSVIPASAGDTVLYDSGSFIRTAREIHVANEVFRILGLACLISIMFLSYRLSKILTLSKRDTITATGFIVLSGFLAEYAGYVELYFFSIIALMLLHIVCIDAVHLRKRTLLVPIAFALAVGAHIGNVIYAPIAMLAIIFAEISLTKKLSYLAVFFAALYLVLILSGITILDFMGMLSMKHSEAGTHFIPLVSATKSTHNYTAFSLYHFLDLADVILLVQPFAFIVIIYALMKTKIQKLRKVEWMLISSSAVSLGMMFIFNCDIGMVADWDLLTPYFVPPIITAIWLLRQLEPGKHSFYAAGFPVIALGAHTLLWMIVLSNDTASIERLSSMQNSRTFSKDGLLVTTTRIAQYDLPRGNSGRAIAAYKRLINELSPNDPRGYFTLSNLLERLDRKSESNEVLALAFTRGISDYRIDFNYAGVLSDQGAFTQSNQALRQSLSKLPHTDSTTKAKIWASLALNYIMMDSIPDAKTAFKNAFEADSRSEFALVYYGQFLLVVEHNPTEAKRVAEQVLLISNDEQIRARAEAIIQNVDSSNEQR